MTTQTRKEAAERLSKDDEPRDAIAMMRDWMGPPDRLAVGRALFEEAIAAERRATVDRIRERILHAGHLNVPAGEIAAILDEEAAR